MRATVADLDTLTPNPARAPSPGERAIIDEVAEVLGVQRLVEEYGYPEIQQVDRPKAAWLGQHVAELRVIDQIGAEPTGRRMISLQKAAVRDPATMRRVLAHEMIHDVQTLRWLASGAEPRLRYTLKHDSGHGRDFLDMAAQVNSRYGEGYVTVESDKSYTVQWDERYLLMLIGRKSNGTLLWTRAPTKREHFQRVGARVVAVRTANVALLRMPVPRWIAKWYYVPEEFRAQVEAVFDRLPTTDSTTGLAMLLAGPKNAYNRYGLDL